MEIAKTEFKTRLVGRLVGLFFFIIFCWNFESFAAAKSKLETSDSPVRIRSDVIDIKRKSQTIDFLKNVVVEKDDSSLLADKMKVLYEEKKQKNSEGKSEIKRIEANGNVKIFSEEFVGSGDFGYYEPRQNIFVLEKNVIINNGTSIASGNKFIYDLASKKGRFIGKKDETSIAGNGGDKRVVVVIGDDVSEMKKSKKNERKSFKR